MQSKRFAIKYFVKGDVTFDLSMLVPIFQRWIQEHAVEGLLIDVADYKHVFQGPGIVLIGHEGDYGFDLRDGRPGLLYTRKRELGTSLADDLRLALRLAQQASRKLESESALNGLQFDHDYAEILFFDRLNTPNTPEVFASLHDMLNEIAPSVAANAEVQSIEADPRKPLTVRVGLAHAAEVHS